MEIVRADRPRLLLVEDDVDAAECFAQLLRIDGYEVDIANSITVAKEIASDKPFDLLLCDLSLQARDGHDILLELNAATGLNGIAFRGGSTDRDIAASTGPGFFDHLERPFDLNQAKADISKAFRVMADQTTHVPPAWG